MTWRFCIGGELHNLIFEKEKEKSMKANNIFRFCKCAKDNLYILYKASITYLQGGTEFLTFYDT